MDSSQYLIHKYRGRIGIEPGAGLMPHEWAMAEIILRCLDGKVIVQKVSDIPGVKRADMLYNGDLAELKHTAGLLATLDGHLRRAAKQAKGELVFIDITGASYSNTDAVAVIINRMHRSGLKETLLMRDGKIIMSVHQDSKGFATKRPPTALQ